MYTMRVRVRPGKFTKVYRLRITEVIILENRVKALTVVEVGPAAEDFRGASHFGTGGRLGL